MPRVSNNQEVEKAKDTSLNEEKLLETIKMLQEQVEFLKNKVDEKPEVQQIRQVARKVKVTSLVPNMYVLSTAENGRGRVYKFSKFGDSCIMKVDDLEYILSIPGYREQAEKGKFYICDADIVEEFGLTEEYEKLNDASTVESIIQLNSQVDVDKFCSLTKSMKESIGTKIAENMAKGQYYDRNLLASIKKATGIDIEYISEGFKKVTDKI